MENFKKILVQLFCTKIGWIFVSLFLVGVFGIISNLFNCFWAEIAMYVCLVYPAILLVVLIVFALIINPIRDYKIRKDFKKFRDGK